MSDLETFAVIDATGTVVNLCLWDGVTDFQPAGMALVRSDSARVGDHYAGGAFTPPLLNEPAA